MKHTGAAALLLLSLVVLPFTARGASVAEQWQATPLHDKELFILGFLSGFCEGGKRIYDAIHDMAEVKGPTEFVRSMAESRCDAYANEDGLEFCLLIADWAYTQPLYENRSIAEILMDHTLWELGAVPKEAREQALSALAEQLRKKK